MPRSDPHDEPTELPAASLRLFPSYDPEQLARPDSRSFVIARLLEEGDRRDLDWLCSRLEETEIAQWVERRSGRQLSRRSLAFWSRLLDATPRDTADDALWPL